MEPPIKDDDQPRSTQMVYRGVEERFEAVQDEVNLLKAEIKQTLIDLREFMMKGHAIASPSVFDGPQAYSPNGQGAAGDTWGDGLFSLAPAAPPAALPEPSPAPALRYSETAHQNALGDTQGRYPMDSVKMGHIIGWLGTVASRGLSPTQLKPFLQTYEQSGHLSPSLSKLTYKSLEDMERVQGGQAVQSFSPSEYAQCLLELHEIICNPGYVPADVTPVPEVQVESPRAQEVKARKQAKNATHNGRKRKQAGPVVPSVKPREEAGLDPLGGAQIG